MGCIRVRRLVNKEVSDLWRILHPEDKCISGESTSDEYILALQQLKLGKTLALTP